MIERILKKIRSFIKNPPDVFLVYFLRIWSQLFKLPNTVKKLREEQILSKEFLSKQISEISNRLYILENKLSQLKEQSDSKTSSLENKLSQLKEQSDSKTSSLENKLSQLDSEIKNKILNLNKFQMENKNNLLEYKTKLENFINNTSTFLSDIHSLEFIRTPLNLLSEEQKFLTSSYPYSIQTAIRTLKRELHEIRLIINKIKIEEVPNKDLSHSDV